MHWHFGLTIIWLSVGYATIIYLDNDAQNQLPVLERLLGSIHGISSLQDSGQQTLGIADSKKPASIPERCNETPVDPDRYPIVDLGYTCHQAADWLDDSSTSPSHIFRNVRYARPPLGELRFKAPQNPLPNATEGAVENGRGRKMCLNGNIAWKKTYDRCTTGSQDSEDHDNDENEDDSEHLTPYAGIIPGLPLDSPKFYNEDCLTLDVFTPHEVFANRTTKKVPVIVWIYGGAYIFGGTQAYKPGPIINRSLLDGRGGIVWVMMNYRMGALGFAAGKDIPDADVNAGFLDQEKALQWVQDHIEKFGGDPAQVTLAGLSAGGGSILHHLTARGDQKTSLFHRAISYGGGWQPVSNPSAGERDFRSFMEFNEVDSIDALRKISEDQMRVNNHAHIQQSCPASFTYNPITWGDFSPESPAKLLKSGKFARNVDVFLSHSLTEGNTFTDVFDTKKTPIDKFLEMAVPDATEQDLQRIKKWYVDEPPGRTTVESIAEIIGNVTFRCHATYASDAIHTYGSSEQNVWRQVWAAGKGHGTDFNYIFSNTGIPGIPKSKKLANIVQDYMVTFAIYGKPSTTQETTHEIPPFLPYEPHRKTIQTIGLDILNRPRIEHTTLNEHDETKCRLWQAMSFT